MTVAVRNTLNYYKDMNSLSLIQDYTNSIDKKIVSANFEEMKTILLYKDVDDELEISIIKNEAIYNDFLQNLINVNFTFSADDFNLIQNISSIVDMVVPQNIGPIEISLLSNKLLENIDLLPESEKIKIEKIKEKLNHHLKVEKILSPYNLSATYEMGIRNKTEKYSPLLFRLEIDYSQLFKGIIQLNPLDLPRISKSHIDFGNDEDKKNYQVNLMDIKSYNSLLEAHDKDDILNNDERNLRWNALVHILFSSLSNIEINEKLTVLEQLWVFDPDENIDILVRNYKLAIDDLANRKDNETPSLQLFSQFISKPKETLPLNHQNMIENILEQDKTTFVGQIKYNKMDNGQLFGLNINQRIFLDYSNRSNNNIIALNGPPGTGKTTVLQSFIATSIVNEHLKKNNPIFVGVAATHQAKNNIIDGFNLNKILDENSLLFEHRWIPKIGKKNISYGVAFKLKNDSDDLLEFEELLGAVTNNEFLNKAESFYIDAFKKSIDDGLYNKRFEDVKKIFIVPNTNMSIPSTPNIDNILIYLEKEIAKVHSGLVELEKIKKSICSHLYENGDTLDKYQKILLWKEKLPNILNGWTTYKQNRSLLTKILNQFNIGIKKNTHNETFNLLFQNNGLTPESYVPNLHSLNLFELDNCLNINIPTAINVDWKILDKKIQHGKELQNNYINKILESNHINCQRILKEKEILEKDPQNINSKIALYNNLSYIIENSFKSTLFNLVMRYNEGLFIREMRNTLNNQNIITKGKFSTKKDAVITKFKLLSLLTPVFVSTAHSVLKPFTYFSANKTKILYDFADYLLIDEAGQCSPEIGALSFLIAKKAVVVGDTAQIEPVWNATPEEDFHIYKKYNNKIQIEDFKKLATNSHNSSLMKIAQTQSEFFPYEEKKLSQGFYLVEHRRCPNEIISYCNELIYNGQLEYSEGSEFDKIRQQNKLYIPEQTPWKLIEVNGKAKVSSGQSNFIEATEILKWIDDNLHYLTKNGKQKLSEVIAIISPFRKQELIINDIANKMIQNNELKNFKKEHLTGLTIGTVHKLQGAEKPIILFSMVCDAEQAGNTLYIDRQITIINVAVSRAKQSIYIFGEPEIFKKAHPNSATGLLGKYCNVV